MADGNGSIRILLADEQALFREAVKVVLGTNPDLFVAAEARDGLQAVAEAERTIPDVALLDANLPNCDGIRATRLIKERIPQCKVALFVEEEDDETLVEALEAGASAYLTKACPLVELVDATRAVHRGEVLIPKGMLGALLGKLIQRRRRQDTAIHRLSRLTRREKEVLALLSQGSDNKAIAQALVISPQTARTHIQNVLAKLSVHSRLEAAAFVMQNGVLEDLVVEGVADA